MGLINDISSYVEISKDGTAQVTEVDRNLLRNIVFSLQGLAERTEMVLTYYESLAADEEEEEEEEEDDDDEDFIVSDTECTGLSECCDVELPDVPSEQE